MKSGKERLDHEHVTQSDIGVHFGFIRCGGKWICNGSAPWSRRPLRLLRRRPVLRARLLPGTLLHVSLLRLPGACICLPRACLWLSAGSGVFIPAACLRRTGRSRGVTGTCAASGRLVLLRRFEGLLPLRERMSRWVATRSSPAACSLIAGELGVTSNHRSMLLYCAGMGLRACLDPLWFGAGR